MRHLLIVCILCLCAIASAKPVPKHGFDGQTAEQGTIVPAGVPLKARLIANGTIFRLDRDGLSQDGYVKLLQQAKKTGKLPPPPQVDVVFELENTADKEVQIVVGGDACGVPRLNLVGPGAVNITFRAVAQSDEFKPPRMVKLAPGGRHRWVFRELDCSGPRDQARCYWTQPGEYRLSVGFTVAVLPRPSGSVPHWYYRDHGNVAIQSGTLRLIVMEK